MKRTWRRVLFSYKASSHTTLAPVRSHPYCPGGDCWPPVTYSGNRVYRLLAINNYSYLSGYSGSLRNILSVHSKY